MQEVLERLEEDYNSAEFEGHVVEQVSLLYIVSCETCTALVKFSFGNLIVYFYYVS